MINIQIGKHMGRGYSDFAFEGSLVAYDMELFHQFYDNYKKNYLTMDKPPPLETNEYTLKVRTQLNTGGNKPYVYFATNRLGQNVVVKGPYIYENSALLPFKLHNIMVLFEGINTYGINIRLLYPDLWEKVGLGTRNYVKKEDFYYFVIMDDILNQKKYPTTTKSSKMWKNEVIANYDSLFEQQPHLSFGVPSKISEKARFSLLIQLAFRLAFEIGDNSYRNFIRVHDTVYNIDLEGIMVSTNIKFAKAEIGILNATRAKYWTEYSKIVESWLGGGNGYYNRWDICKTTLTKDIEKIRNNIRKLLDFKNII
jgi:hypothetical protein